MNTPKTLKIPMKLIREINRVWIENRISFDEPYYSADFMPYWHLYATIGNIVYPMRDSIRAELLRALDQR